MTADRAEECPQEDNTTAKATRVLTERSLYCWDRGGWWRASGSDRVRGVGRCTFILLSSDKVWKLLREAFTSSEMTDLSFCFSDWSRVGGLLRHNISTAICKTDKNIPQWLTTQHKGFILLSRQVSAAKNNNTDVNIHSHPAGFFVTLPDNTNRFFCTVPRSHWCEWLSRWI